MMQVGTIILINPTSKRKEEMSKYILWHLPRDLAVCLPWVASLSSCGKQGLLFVAVHRPLVAEHRLWVSGLQCLEPMGSVTAA